MQQCIPLPKLDLDSSGMSKIFDFFFTSDFFSEILEELQDFGGNDLTLKISCRLIIAAVGDGLFSCSIPSLGDGSDACDIRLLM